jgi:hypothetical protein
MEYGISHDRAEESLEAKARWFRSLTVEERMAYIDEITELIIENNPEVLRHKDVKPMPGRVRVLEIP